MSIGAFPVDAIDVAAPSSEAPRSSRSPLAVSWTITLLTAGTWLWVALEGASIELAQTFGVGLCAALTVGLGVAVWRSPASLVRPVNVFFLGCIYFFVLDAAILREVRGFDPSIILAADTLVAAFLVAVTTTHWAIRWQPPRNLLRGRALDFSGNVYFWIVVMTVVLQYFRFLCFEDFSVVRLWHDLLLSRSGGAFRRGAAGDWRVFLQPLDVLFLAVCGFADLAWRRGVSVPRKMILLLAVMLQLATLVLDGVRGDLLTALLLPLFIRSAQHDRSVGRWMVAFILASFLLAPVMDLMNQNRGGWHDLAEDQVHWNIVQAHRDDNFFYLTNLVAYRSQGQPGLISYKGALGFVDGIAEVGWQWIEMPIPRVLWPNKPKWWEMHDETRNANDTDSIVADLYRAGGISMVFVGGALVGIWLSWLESLYVAPKDDARTLVFAFLAAATISMTRGASPINTQPLLLSCVVLMLTLKVVGKFSQRGFDSSWYTLVDARPDWQ